MTQMSVPCAFAHLQLYRIIARGARIPASRVQLRKRKKVNDAIDENLELLLNDHKDGLITSMQLAIKYGRGLKTKLVK